MLGVAGKGGGQEGRLRRGKVVVEAAVGLMNGGGDMVGGSGRAVAGVAEGGPGGAERNARRRGLTGGRVGAGGGAGEREWAVCWWWRLIASGDTLESAFPNMSGLHTPPLDKGFV